MDKAPEPLTDNGLLQGRDKPLPRRISDLLIARIFMGELKPGDRLPPDRVLAEQLGVDRTSLPTLLGDGKFRLVRAFATYDTQRARIVFGQGTYDDEKDTESQDKIYSATRQGITRFDPERKVFGVV